MRLLTPLLVVVLLAGCSADPDEPAAAPSQPAESSFAEGTCRLAAPDVLAVGSDLTRLGEEQVPQPVKDSLTEAQSRLDSLAETAEPAVQEPLQQLVVSLGLLRIRADGNTYEPSLAEPVKAAYEQVVTACTSTG